MWYLAQGGGGMWIPNQGWDGGVRPKAEKKKVTPTILMVQLTTPATEMVSDATSD